MVRRQYPAQRSPLHAEALRLQDLKIGLEIIQFNIEQGVVSAGRLVSRPYVGFISTDEAVVKNQGMKLVVKIEKDDGVVTNMSLGDLGVIPYMPDGIWNCTNFTIDARKRHLLPTPTPRIGWTERQWSQSRNSASDRYRHPVA